MSTTFPQFSELDWKESGGKSSSSSSAAAGYDPKDWDSTWDTSKSGSGSGGSGGRESAFISGLRKMVTEATNKKGAPAAPSPSADPNSSE